MEYELMAHFINWKQQDHRTVQQGLCREYLFTTVIMIVECCCCRFQLSINSSQSYQGVMLSSLLVYDFMPCLVNVSSSSCNSSSWRYDAASVYLRPSLMLLRCMYLWYAIHVSEMCKMSGSVFFVLSFKNTAWQQKGMKGLSKHFHTKYTFLVALAMQSS